MSPRTGRAFAVAVLVGVVGFAVYLSSQAAVEVYGLSRIEGIGWTLVAFIATAVLSAGVIRALQPPDEQTVPEGERVTIDA